MTYNALSTQPLILVVEDNRSFREVIFESLSSSFEVQVAKNGIQALEFLKQTIPDLVLLDIMLPFPLDGFSILRILKSEQRLSSVPVIIMSALSSDNNITSGLELGANDYVVKPFRMQEILLKIRNLISIKTTIINQVEKDVLLKRIVQTDTGFETTFRKKFEAIVEQMIEEPAPSIQLIASDLSMSISTLERWVKKMYNVTPKRYLLNAKLFKAEIMLRQQLGSVKDIAYLLGFNSVPYFCLCFKNHYGKSPKAYAKQKP